MEPSCFQGVASDLLNLKLNPGYQISYCQPHAKISINAATNLSQPSFTTSFKLTPGTIEVGVPPTKDAAPEVNVTVLPDLSAFGAKLAFYPLKNGQFDLTMNKQFCFVNATCNYKSEKHDFTLTLDPKKKFGDVTLEGHAVINALDRVPAGRVMLQYKNITLRSCYIQDKNLLCGAAFYNVGPIGPLCGLATGALLKYGIQTNKPDTIELYLKGQKKQCNFAAIVSALQKSVELHYSGKFQCSKNQVEVGTISTVSFADKVNYDFKVGLKFVPPCNNNVHIVFDKTGKLSTKLSFAHCNKCNASADLGVTLDKVCLDKDQLKPHFSVSVSFLEKSE